ncbi:hypothetical protein TIFTF001_009551 [Ficus carica]|uniref:Uncharacterized protein n=1 Tax=Ficus carica TaxID=3494 RepID=A0AA88D3P7_FICCA|nr:hypothetical protein TIFTF001_009551 [Ficus carica]
MEGSSIWVKTSSMKNEVESKGAIRCKCDILAVVRMTKTEKDNSLDAANTRANQNLGVGLVDGLMMLMINGQRMFDDLNEKSVKSIARMGNEVSQLRLQISSMPVV